MEQFGTTKYHWIIMGILIFAFLCIGGLIGGRLVFTFLSSIFLGG